MWEHDFLEDLLDNLTEENESGFIIENNVHECIDIELTDSIVAKGVKLPPTNSDYSSY